MLVHAEDAEAARAFICDVLEWRCVHAHDGWLTFGSGPSELGVHPTAGGAAPRDLAPDVPGAGQMLLNESRHSTAFDL